MACGSSRARENSSRVGPIQEDVERDAEEGGSVSCNMSAKATKQQRRHTYPRSMRREKSYRGLNPDCPARDAVDKYQWEVCGA